MSTLQNIKPTNSEMEILGVLWQKGSANVREVFEHIAKSKDVGYTTTLKLMQIMHKKGLVTRAENSKTHIYYPSVSKAAAGSHMLKSMIDNVFQGSASSLVLQVLGEYKTSKEDLNKIEALLNEIKQ
jgi:BlaI family transcriptional regulator, penicillinase repressor